MRSSTKSSLSILLTLTLCACSKSKQEVPATAPPAAAAVPSAVPAAASTAVQGAPAAAVAKAPLFGGVSARGEERGTFKEAAEVKSVRLGSSQPRGARLKVVQNAHNVEVTLWQAGRALASCSEPDPDRLPKICLFDVPAAEGSELRAKHLSFDDISPTNHYVFSWSVQPKLADSAVITAADGAEGDAHRAYRSALTEGRKLTQQKKYDEAIAAFDRALTHWPDSAQGLGERGYARLLSGDLAHARADLEAASKRTQEPKLLSGIEFNFGLVDEKLGDAQGARRHFTKAHELRPSAATKKKLEGAQAAADACSIQTSWQQTKELSFSSWLEAFRALQHGAGLAAPSTEAQAKELLTAPCALEGGIGVTLDATDSQACRAVLDDGSARVIRYEDDEGHDRIAVALERAGAIKVWQDDAWIRYSGRCGPPEYQLLLSRVGERLQLRVFAAEVMPVQLCSKPGGGEEDFDVCDDTYTVPVSSACGDPSWYSRHDAVIDPKRGFLVRLDGWVSSEGAQPLATLQAASVAVREDRIELQSGRCAQSVPLR